MDDVPLTQCLFHSEKQIHNLKTVIEQVEITSIWQVHMSINGGQEGRKNQAETGQ
jgi:hypothetical protein